MCSLTSMIRWLLVVAVLLPADVWAQASAFGSITGRVTDDTGAAMASVTITVKSPALQVSQVSATTDTEGNYRVLDLPAPGLYDISFAAGGFQTYVRGGLNLSVGFAARVDVTMKVGQSSQAVEVTGSNPVIDSVDTAGTTTLQQAELQEIPKGATLSELFPLAAGVSMQGKPDVGDSNLATRTFLITYGVLLQPNLNIEGISITAGDGPDTGPYFSLYDVGEVEFKTSGNNADVAFAGVAMEAQVKSGGNSFHGSLRGDWENSSFQGNNITPALAAQRLKFTNPLRTYYDYTGEVGGRIIRNKLWFYTGLSKQTATQGQIGFVSGPDASGCWTCGDAPQAYITTALTQENIKLSYQPNPTTRILGVWQHSLKYLSAQSASSTVPLPSTMVQHSPYNLWKGEVQSTPTAHFVIDGIFGYAGYVVHYTDQPGIDVAGNPSSRELSTGLFTGPSSSGPQNKPARRYEPKGSVAYIAGKHQFKFGTDNTWEELDTQVPTNTASGNYLLVFNKGVPNQIQTYNFPFIPQNKLTSQSVFAIDTWSVGRLTINYGARWERYHSFYPTQTKPAGQFSPAATFTGQDILTWKDFVPRVGVAWDVFGSGKTVIKGSFGKFGDTMRSAFAGTFNPNALVTTTYRWNGPCMGTAFNNVSYDNSSCDTTPATLASLKPGSPDFISAVGGLNELVNPNLKQDKIYEYALRIERQLIPNVALRLGYVQHRVYYLYNSLEPNTISTASGVNTLIPFSAYTVPVTLVDALTNNPVTLYTYPASFAKAGSLFQLTNAPGSRPDIYHSFEMAVTKRYSKKWNAQGSFWITRYHQWIQAIEPNPNARAFPIDNTWNWEARAFGSYNLPLGFVVAAYYRAQSGIYGQRTESFSSPLLLQGSVTQRMEPFGSKQGPAIAVADLKLAKNFRFGENLRLQANFQVFNLFNSSAATSTSYLTGPTYLRTTGIVSPRVARIAMEIHF